MKKLKVSIFIGILLLCLISYSCRRKEKIAASTLAKVEVLNSVHPDSALFLLQNLNINNEDVSLKAKYALLFTQAEDKNYILHTNDSLINIAVNFYDSVKNIGQAAKAHYYLGRVYQDMQNEAGAVSEFLIALPLAEQVGESKILCLLYGNLGQVYFQQGLLARADSLFILSENIAIQKNDSFNLAMGLIARGNVRLQKEEHSSAMAFFERALVIARNMHNANVQEVVFNSMAAFYASINCPEKTIEYSQKGLLYKADSLDSARLYLLRGSALMQLAEYDSAKFSINKSISTNNLSTKAAAYLLLADIEEKQGDLSKAFSYQNLYVECVDSMDLLESRTFHAISKGNRLLYSGRHQRLLNSYQLYLYGLLLFLLLLIIYWINKRYKYYNKINVLTLKKDSLECQLRTFSVMQEDLRKKEKELELLREFIGTAEEDKMKLYYLTNQVNTLKKENKDFFLKLLKNTRSYKLLLQLIQRRKDDYKCRELYSEKDWDALLQDINHFSNGFVERLKEQVPLLSKNDIRFCCLFKIGISYVDMALVFDRTLDAMYKKRNAILMNKLVNMSNSNSLDEFIDAI